MKVVWADEAKAHLDGIYQYIKRDSPFYASQTVDKLTRRVDRLIYRLKPDRIDIIAVFHGAQQLPDSL